MAEGTGLLNRTDGDDEPTPKPAQRETSDDPVESSPTSLVACLRKSPELAEVVDAWPLLDEPIRQAILALARVKPRD